MSDDRKSSSDRVPQSGPPDLGEAWEGEGAEATIATPFERIEAVPPTPRTSAPPTAPAPNGPSTVPKPPSAPRAPRPASSGMTPRTPDVPRLSEDTDPENDRTRADALPGMAAALKNFGKPAPKTPLAGTFGVVPDVGADLDPPASEDDAETRAITREELGRPPDSSRVVYDRDAGGYEKTVAASFPSSSGNGGDKIAAALAEALQQGRDLGSGSAIPSMRGPADLTRRPALHETLPTPQYPPGVPVPAPAPVLPSSSRFPAAPGAMGGFGAGAQPPMFTGPIASGAPSAMPFGGHRSGAPPLNPPWRSQVAGPHVPMPPGYPMPTSGMAPTPAPGPSNKHVVLVVAVGVVCIAIFVVGVVLILSTSF